MRTKCLTIPGLRFSGGSLSGPIMTNYEFQIFRLFSAEPQQIGPVPEINVPDTTPDHHQKFRGDSSKEPTLVRFGTDKRTDRLRHGRTPSNPLPRSPNLSAAKIVIFNTTVPLLRSGTDKLLAPNSAMVATLFSAPGRLTT